ncbi:hypothetical protein AWC38_SpisGene20937 [Stylophora pistillata]|uniref:Uncharacterized protein n=1 Tax=Stylophora pistillata TaxID=50429 RepID=A0A2B4RDI0_STYPI|nr:hypothetical protein AWC38_SpisGene20937 [Stylophora pistillata]
MTVNFLEYQPMATDTLKILAFKVVFTNLNTSGRIGPTTLGSNYTGEDHDGQVTLSSGVQQWTIPYTGDYRIKAIAAAGGYDGHSNSFQYRGRGARMIGTFRLTKGEVIQILVGQEGGINTVEKSSGGGGGTFVVRGANTPLIIAGGGGGVNAGGGGGGGFYSSGISGKNFNGTKGWSGEGGKGFLQGGLGGRAWYDDVDGGFGGGGGAYGWGRGGGGGGGGGYSGGSRGAGGYDTYASCGGGGGSYSDGNNQDNECCYNNAGHGQVTITFLELKKTFI